MVLQYWTRGQDESQDWGEKSWERISSVASFKPSTSNIPSDLHFLFSNGTYVCREVSKHLQSQIQERIKTARFYFTSLFSSHHTSSASKLIKHHPHHNRVLRTRTLQLPNRGLNALPVVHPLTPRNRSTASFNHHLHHHRPRADVLEDL